MDNGKRSKSSYQSQDQIRKEADPGLTIAEFSRASSGFFEPEHLGQTCQNDIQVPQPAGEDSSSGKNRIFGLMLGELSSQSLTRKAS